MTQIFDPETGAVTPVTVIVAGPCPVVQVKTADTTATRRSNWPSTRCSTQAQQARARPPRPLRGRPAPHAGRVPRRDRRCGRRRGSDGRAVRTGRHDQGLRDRDRQGLPGDDQAPQLLERSRAHGSHNVRAPGSIGASATPSRVFKGIKMAGRMGGKRVTQLGVTVHDVDPTRNLLLVKGAIPGPRKRTRRGARLDGRAHGTSARRERRVGERGHARRGDLRDRAQAPPDPRGCPRGAQRPARRDIRK